MMGMTTLLGAAAHDAKAADQPKMSRSPLLVEVARCRQIQNPAERLACFDASVAVLDGAEKRHDLVVVDRQQVRQARKSLFGISISNLPIFGGAPDIDYVDTSLTDAQVDAAGRWTLRMADGARWVQTDDNVIARRPKPNDKVHIKRAALGSFQLSVGDQPAVKARRVN